jgi:HEAT repeat protein
VTSPGSADPATSALDRIGLKLEQARSRGLACFGSETHRFVLRQPLSEAAAAGFEQDHGVLLSAEHREFVIRLGDGGAGPYYGLLPLADWCSGIYGDPATALSRPSPLRPGMPCGTDAAAFLGCDVDALTDGAITLGHQGCAFYSLLIVTGLYRGAVVNVDLDFGGPPYFTRDPDFLSWYERWLDELLWGWEGSWFGFGLPGHEPGLAAALLRPPYADRSDALRTLARIPALRADTLAAISVCLDDERAPVREAATSLLGRHGGADADRLIAERLGDPDPGVRSAALAALPVNGEDSTDALRAALADTDPEVVRTALRLLADYGRLDEGDLTPLLSHASPAIRSTGVFYLEKTQAAAVPAAMFTDTDPGVARQAVLTTAHLGDRQATPHLLRLLSTSSDPDLRTLTVRTLGQLADPAAFEPLLAETAATDAFTRLEAARALGALSDPRARPALKALLTDTTKPERHDQAGMVSVSSAWSVAQVAQDALRKLPHRWHRLPQRR